MKTVEKRMVVKRKASLRPPATLSTEQDSILISKDDVNGFVSISDTYKPWRYECGAYNIGGKAGINGTSATSQSKVCSWYIQYYTVDEE
jgi:hypothetical protein